MSLSTQMKTTAQYFPVVLFIILDKSILTFESARMKCLSVTTQMKANEEYFPVVLFITLHRVIQAFQSMDEILQCDH